MYNININGELTERTFEADRMDVPLVALDDLSVQLSINEEGDQSRWRCSGCGEESHEDTPEQGECDGSGNLIDCVEHELDEDGDCEHCDGSGEIEVHDWQELALHWVNSASIHADPSADIITVTISVGDPRGAFVMSVERMSDGELRLSVPHATMSAPHMPLTEYGPGWFKVGH